jgi:hypothetical protein
MAERPIGFQPADLHTERAIESLRQFGRERDSDRATLASPRGALATLLRQAGERYCNAEAELAFRHMRKPGRAGAKAVINIAGSVPGAMLPGVVVEMYERQVNRHGFAFALVTAWHASGGTLHRQAGSRARLAAMFAYARVDDPLPIMKPLCGLGELADTFTAYRGGRGTPEEVGTRGLSWSLRRWPASYYALRTHAWSVELHGSPVLLRRQVRREEALYWIKGNDEVILSGFGPYEIDTADEAEIRALYDAGKDELETSEAEAEAFRRRIMATPEEELWQGWER